MPEHAGSLQVAVSPYVAVIANAQREAALDCARALTAYLRSRGVRVRFDVRLAEALGCPEEASPEPVLEQAGLVIALGGDGTLLAAARIAAPREVPVLGIHIGGPASFGFLTETTPDQAAAAMDAVLAGTYRLEARLMAIAVVEREGECVGNFEALNDLVIRAQARMLKMRVSVADTFIATYAADGIIVATPTGSTAYNLAAGGPVVNPEIEAILLTPICPHTLNVRTLLVSVRDEIVVTLESGARDVTRLTVDGQTSFELLPGDRIRLAASPRRAQFVSLNGPNFYTKVQTRLRLGERFGS
jgi:NAD+ kinase